MSRHRRSLPPSCAPTTNATGRSSSPSDSRWTSASIVELDNVEAADLVGEEDQAAVVLGDVVGPRHVAPRRRLRNDEALLPRMDRIADVDHPQARCEPRHIKHAVAIHDLAKLMRAEAHVVAVIGLRSLVELVGAEDV